MAKLFHVTASVYLYAKDAAEAKSKFLERVADDEFDASPVEVEQASKRTVSRNRTVSIEEV